MGTTWRPRGRDDQRAGAARPAPAHHAGRVLAGLELFTGASALVSGVLLAVAPDGSLLRADTAALAGSPFSDYRWPGVLLGTLVGGGYLLTGFWQWRSGRGARALSVLAGVGLLAFEAAELLWLGFQPLEGVFAVIGATVATLALLTPSDAMPSDGAEA